MFKPTIGLEIHSELNTKSKMFCSCRNDPDEKRPNVNICPVCLAHPGTLPVVNKEAVKKVIKTGLALKCKIADISKFDRKNYFYPDLPKGYQISQYDMPLCSEGFLNINTGKEDKKIRITRIHLEEDTGRLIHPGRDTGDNNKNIDYSLIDFNRAGIPLMELVTEPDLNSGKEARKFAEGFQSILRYLGVSYADMEKGQFRVEVNISLSKDEKLGTKVEIKNLNSFRAVEGAVDYETKRQKKILEKGDKVIQETRGWDKIKGITISQRIKEEANDYRYFPDPDLPTLKLPKDFINEIKAEIPELPQERKERMIKEYRLNEKEADFFVLNKELGDYFEKVASESREWIKESEIKEVVRGDEFLKLIKLATNYITSDLQGLLRGMSVRDDGFLITPENFAEFITLIYKGRISSKIAKNLLEEMFKNGADPSQIIEERGLVQITDESEIEKIIEKVISENEKAVSDYKKGKEASFQFLIGQIMRESKGKANPEKISKILKKLLDKNIIK